MSPLGLAEPAGDTATADAQPPAHKPVPTALLLCSTLPFNFYRKGQKFTPSLLRFQWTCRQAHRRTHVHNNCLAIHLHLVLHFQIFHSLLGSVNNTLYKHHERIIQERLNLVMCGDEDLIDLFR